MEPESLGLASLSSPCLILSLTSASPYLQQSLPYSGIERCYLSLGLAVLPSSSLLSKLWLLWPWRRGTEERRHVPPSSSLTLAVSA